MLFYLCIAMYYIYNLYVVLRDARQKTRQGFHCRRFVVERPAKEDEKMSSKTC